VLLLRHVLASHGEGGAWQDLAVDGGGDGPGSSPSFGEVDRCGSLLYERGLAMVQLGELGFNGCSLAGELVLPLCGFALDIHLSSAGSRSLLLLKGLLLLREEPDA
jgi:hypothetical protein